MLNKEPTNIESVRNQSLYNDWKLTGSDGKKIFKIKELLGKYNIKTRAQLYQIVQSEEIKELRAKIKEANIK